MNGIELLIKSIGLDPEMLREIAERTVQILRSYETDRAHLNARLTAIEADLASVVNAVADEDEDEDEDDDTTRVGYSKDED